MVKYTIKYFRDKCIAAASCAEIAPEVWELDDEGKAILKIAEFTDEELDINVKAAKSCPAHAIEIYDEEGKQIV